MTGIVMIDATMATDDQERTTQEREHMKVVDMKIQENYGDTDEVTLGLSGGFPTISLSSVSLVHLGVRCIQHSSFKSPMLQNSAFSGPDCVRHIWVHVLHIEGDRAVLVCLVH